MTFVASTGDYGTADPEYPAFSPNVVAVGGTSLYLNADNSYNSETGWGYYSSGVGDVHRQRRRRQPVRGRAGLPAGRPVHRLPHHARRVASWPTRPPGAWIADPYNLSADNPWEVVGGTSLSAPSWAGLIALANQGRAAAGEATLGTRQPDRSPAGPLQPAAERFQRHHQRHQRRLQRRRRLQPGDRPGHARRPISLVPDLVANNFSANPGWQVTVTSASVAASGVTQGGVANAIINVFDALVVGSGLGFGTAPASVNNPSQIGHAGTPDQGSGLAAGNLAQAGQLGGSRVLHSSNTVVTRNRDSFEPRRWQSGQRGQHDGGPRATMSCRQTRPRWCSRSSRTAGTPRTSGPVTGRRCWATAAAWTTARWPIRWGPSVRPAMRSMRSSAPLKATIRMGWALCRGCPRAMDKMVCPSRGRPTAWRPSGLAAARWNWRRPMRAAAITPLGALALAAFVLPAFGFSALDAEKRRMGSHCPR